MTLRSRNRLLLLFCITSLAVCSISLIFFFVQFIRHSVAITPYDTSTLHEPFLHPLFEPHFFASILALIIVLLYLPVTGFFILLNFEKTQAPEVVYFTLFLTGIFLQAVRIFVPLLHLNDGYRSIIILISRMFFSGQLLSLLSLWFISFCSTEDPLQKIDRNGLIIIVVVFIIAFSMPINTHTLTSTFIYKIGFSQLYAILKYALIFITAIALVLRAKEDHTKNYFLFSFSYLLLVAGAIILSIADNYAFCIIGTPLLVVGTTLFLKKLHKHYLWR